MPCAHFDSGLCCAVMYEKLECPCLGHLDAAHKLVEKVLIYLIHLSFREHRHLRHRVLSQVGNDIRWMLLMVTLVLGGCAQPLRPAGPVQLVGLLRVSN